MGPNREPSTRIDEDLLLQRVAMGDRLAFERLYAQTHNRIGRIAQRHVGRQHEVEELVQDVFLTIWTRAAQFDPARGSAQAWMATATRNRCIDWLRSHQVRDRAALLDDEAIDESAPDRLHAEIDEDRDQLLLRLGELSERRRSLIRRSFFDGATHDEIASSDGVPLGTVKSTIRRALGQLRLAFRKR